MPAYTTPHKAITIPVVHGTRDLAGQDTNWPVSAHGQGSSSCRTTPGAVSHTDIIQDIRLTASSSVYPKEGMASRLHGWQAPRNAEQFLQWYKTAADCKCTQFAKYILTALLLQKVADITQSCRPTQ